MKEQDNRECRSRKSLLMMLAFVCVQFNANPLSAAPRDTSTTFVVKTYDGLELPAQVTLASAPFKKLVILIHGSTPYDQFGYLGPGWGKDGRIIKQKNSFYLRFLEVMPSKGYAVATMAKRSFVYPHRLPRPSLDELALDIQFLVWELKRRTLLRGEEDLVIVGYSEGSIVASKLLGLLKRQPAGCVLLGSASLAYNYKTQGWQDWFFTDIYRKTKKVTDEQLEKEFKEFGSLQENLLVMDEDTFEAKYKHSSPFGFNFSPWESYHIDKEVQYYDPTANLMASNIPILICIGERDVSMPRVLAQRTYDRLREGGYDKATFRVIENEVHQYTKYDVFGIMDAWIASAGATTEFVLNQTDSSYINRYALISALSDSISRLLRGGGVPGRALEVFALAKEAQFEESYPWFQLGIVLFSDGNHDQALFAFHKALDTTSIVRFAAMVWIGHISDLRNKREEALEWYTKAIEAYPGFPVQHSQWNMVIDRHWIEQRLATPFTGITQQVEGTTEK